MLYASLPLFHAVDRKMNFLAKRQRVLAQNIANVDTPEYKARDLRQIEYPRSLKPSRFSFDLQRSDARHFQSARFSPQLRALNSDNFYEATISENTVNLEENLTKINQTESDYALATNIYQKYHGFIRTALGRNNR